MSDDEYDELCNRYNALLDDYDGFLDNYNNLTEKLEALQDQLTIFNTDLQQWLDMDKNRRVILAAPTTCLLLDRGECTESTGVNISDAIRNALAKWRARG